MALGEKLRQARVARGLDIAGLAAQLKIQSRYLAAIEAGQRDQLPSAFLFKNWVRQYAEVLGLDYSELRPEVEGLVAAEAPLPLPGQDQWTAHRKAGRASVNGHGVFRLVASLLTLALVVGAGAGAYAWWRGDLPEIQWSKLRVWEKLPAKAKETSAPKVNAVLAPVVAAPPPTLLLEISAREPSWVSISPDGKLFFSGILRANETRSVQALHSALLRVGNAGGLDVRVNGNSIGEIGPRGKIRILIVSPDGIKILDPKGAKPAQPASV